LLRNQGRAFSRAYLTTPCGASRPSEGDRSSTTAILRLRKKLGRWARRSKTVWGWLSTRRPAGDQPNDQPSSDGHG